MPMFSIAWCLILYMGYLNPRPVRCRMSPRKAFNSSAPDPVPLVLKWVFGHLECLYRGFVGYLTWGLGFRV